MNLFSAATKMAGELNSLYRDNRFGRTDLLEFMDANAWFGVSPAMIGNAPVIQGCDFEHLKSPLTLWLSAYKKPGREKTILMLRHFDGIYPLTCALYHKFVTDRQLEDLPAAWQLLDFLLSEIDREITDYGESDLEKLVARADAGATLLSARLLADFLRTAVHNGRPLTQWVYSFHSRDTPDLIRDAYPLDGFSVMAYCVFNEDMWARQSMIEKAIQNKAYADLWLFVALHFICALRLGDMKRLPAPALPYDGDTVLQKIRDGDFEKRIAVALVEELTIRLKLKPMKPSKTAAHGNVPSLKLSVPESLKAPLGLILAVALAHHPEITPGEGFVFPSENLCHIRHFFGKHFTAALGNRRFSSRRSNKSYLQGIDTANPGTRGKPKGYMLAALARSHKSGIGSLAKTTEIYLKDAKFSGYSPEFIIREMFERGVFSFIPAILLEMYAGPEYTLLPVRAQTKLIGEIGLAARQLEWMTGAMDRALTKSRWIVSTVLRDPSNIRESVAGMLQNIASGNAPSRQRETLCLMTAAGFSCPFADRDACISCGYEIYTKAAMHTLMREYARLFALKQSAGQPDTWRYGKILEQAVLPAVAEMLAAMKLLYGADTAGLLDIVERGLELADHGV